MANSNFYGMIKLNSVEDLEEFERFPDKMAPDLLQDLFEINLECQPINDNTASQIVRVIEHSTNLKKVNLEACRFTSKQMSNLLKAICKNRSLENLMLDLRSTEFNNDCCKAISTMLDRDHAMVSSLKLPKIMDHKMMENILKSILKSNKEIIELDISYSRLSEKSLTSLEDILRNGLVKQSLGVVQCEGWRDGKFYRPTPSDRNHLLDANMASKFSQEKPEIRWAFLGPGAKGAMVKSDSGVNGGNVFKLAKSIGKESKKQALGFLKDIKIKTLKTFGKRKSSEEKCPSEAKKVKFFKNNNEIETRKEEIENVPQAGNIPYSETRNRFSHDQTLTNGVPNIFIGMFANFGRSSTEINNWSSPHSLNRKPE